MSISQFLPEGRCVPASIFSICRAVRWSGFAADTFAAASTQLAAFAAGKDYAAWLVKSAAALAETMGESGTLYARTADLPLLQGKLPAGVALTADDTITLGGLRAANPATGLAADDTLEARLDAQHDWFLQNAGLEITI